jgi:hypothetical protein
VCEHNRVADAARGAGRYGVGRRRIASDRDRFDDDLVRFESRHARSRFTRRERLCRIGSRNGGLFRGRLLGESAIDACRRSASVSALQRSAAASPRPRGDDKQGKKDNEYDDLCIHFSNLGNAARHRRQVLTMVHALPLDSDPVAELDPIYGNRALTERIELHEVKGTLLSARPRYVLERWGNAGLDDVRKRVEGTARQAIEQSILPFSWYPLKVMAEIDRAIVEGPMAGHVPLMKEFGATIARYDLPTIYRVLFKVGTPAFIIRRMNVAYRTYIRHGTMHGETPSPKSATVTFVDGVFPKYLCTHGVVGWLTAALELSGAQRVDVREVECVHEGAATCKWRAEWA